MAKKNWVTDQTIEMRPVGVEDNSPYGIGLLKIYKDHFEGLTKLFRDGITGCCLDEERPLTTEHVVTTIGSGMFSLPGDHHKKSMPAISGSQWLEARFRSKAPVSKRHYRCLRLQGDFEALLEDSANEGCGTLAVAAMHALARNNFFPCSRERSFILNRTCLAAMGADEQHERNWLGCEIDIYAYSLTESPVAVPMDMNGLADLDRIRDVIRGRCE